MKNNVIAIILVSILSINVFASASLSSVASETYPPNSWIDPLSGTTYLSGGQAHFAFNPGVAYDSPWLQIQPPSLKAGCGGISLSAGFAGFLDLQQIGNELQGAISSVGMGVLVALLQTLPTIGNAFKAIEKIVRKIQQLLANACQLTVKAIDSHIINNPNSLYGKAKKKLRSDLASSGGASWMSTLQKGYQSITKYSSNFLGNSSNYTTAKNSAAGTIGLTSDSKYYAMFPSEKAVLSNFITSKHYGVHMGSLSTWFDKGSIAGIGEEPGVSTKTQDITGANFPVDTLPTAIKLKMALFGYFYVDQGTIRNILAYTKAADPAKLLAQKMASNTVANTAPAIKYQAPVQNPLSNIIKFFNGSLTASSVQSLKYPSNIQVLLYVYPAGTAANTYTAGFACNTLPLNQSIKFDTITNNMNIAQDTRATLLNLLNPTKYPAPKNPIGDYIPNGYTYLNIISNYAAPADYPVLVNILAGVNARFALEQLVSQISINAKNMTGKIPPVQYKRYVQRINSVAKIVKKIVGRTADLKVLSMLSAYFHNVKVNGIARHQKRAY